MVVPHHGVMADFMGFEASGAEIPIYGECHGQKKGLRARRPDSLDCIATFVRVRVRDGT